MSPPLFWAPLHSPKLLPPCHMYKLTLAFRATSFSRETPSFSAAETEHVILHVSGGHVVTLLGQGRVVVVALRSEDCFVVASSAGQTEVAAPVEHVEVHTCRKGEELVQGRSQWLSS